MDTNGYKYSPTERKVYFQGQPTDIAKMLQEALIHRESMDKMWPIGFMKGNISDAIGPEEKAAWAAANAANTNIDGVMTSMEKNHGFPKSQISEMIWSALRNTGNDSTKVDLALILELLAQKGWK